MNKTNLKRYAPQARKDFIAAVTARAQLLGLSEVAGQPYAEPCQVNGDVAVIAGRAWPASVQGKRERLLQRMKRDGYTATLEAVAYTWFNRFAALRYMELHDYLGHGRRVLSNSEGALPEILSHALELAEAGDLPGLHAEQVRQLKLENQDGELLRRVLIAQCNGLHGAMPFLFEAVDDETELLLPDNLLLSDSVVAKLISEIPEEDWSEVEAIGWLYQFYIGEKKDEVIGKVVKSEDIPAATQLFTPNWIVQYLVQNSVGRLWLMANPQSTLATEWPYYITPAEQTPEVQAQLDALIQTRVREDGDALNPESVTVLDPACGSGHILVVAYDVLKAIYLERGYQLRAIPRLILEKNLYGLDIDDRAAQLAAFALLMKARADDRRLFIDPPQLNVLSLQESKGLDDDELATQLAPFGLQRPSLKALLVIFEHAKTLGSLIQIPAELTAQLVAMRASLQQALRDGDLYGQQAAKDLLPLVWQALVLGMQFDAVVANPPYMGSKGMNPGLNNYARVSFPETKSDLFAIFMERSFCLCKSSGVSAMVTMQSWMFLASYQDFRKRLLGERTICSLVQIGYNSFPEMNSKIAQAAASVIMVNHIKCSRGNYVDLNSEDQSADKGAAFLSRTAEVCFSVSQSSFESIPGQPLAFQAGEAVRLAFNNNKRIGDVAKPRKGMATGNNDRFVRMWTEVDFHRIGLDLTRATARSSGKKWFPYGNGGGYRKWYGNMEDVVLWERDGEVLQSEKHPNGNIRAVGLNLDYIFKEAVTWSPVTSASFSARLLPKGALFSSASNAIFSDAINSMAMLGQVNSEAFGRFSKIINPTLNLNTGDMENLPAITHTPTLNEISRLATSLVDIHRRDWNVMELSIDYSGPGFIIANPSVGGLASAWEVHRASCESAFQMTKELESRINEIVNTHYGLPPPSSYEPDDSQITLLRADREKDCQRLISYAIGCMMGRYSLDDPGLIYAHAGNLEFDPSRYEKKFPVDSDGIVPITGVSWFEDDAAGRVREFLRSVWGAETLDENMSWLAESLGTKGSETPDETIRRYLADKFFKDHLQTYKKRPIYWQFSSGKHGAFQALVYLHRYHEGTLARMRSEYVLPLTGKMQARMESLEVDIRQASSTAARTKLTKQLDALRKQHHELLAYDEKLRHYADQRISIDLDDGVKVNYGKFGVLLAEVKAVTGGAGDE